MTKNLDLSFYKESETISTTAEHFPFLVIKQSVYYQIYILKTGRRKLRLRLFDKTKYYDVKTVISMLYRLKRCK